MKVFYIKVKTVQDFNSEDDFAARLEELKPSFYNHKTESTEEGDFAEVKVLKIKQI